MSLLRLGIGCNFFIFIFVFVDVALVTVFRKIVVGNSW